ncbi:hypothetical protein CYMTET_44475 [Cymbomonas tetramitiformis]|uniref:Uncharacterized protein n=1 Tax=Cymbomonas tetramitiformis TaxID=36881 RepID=A0AAE0C032_9CHLO|nr:hypothetical protein CYMTET_44475 [Cymbomonas tetramitiformis]
MSYGSADGLLEGSADSPIPVGKPRNRVIKVASAIAIIFAVVSAAVLLHTSRTASGAGKAQASAGEGEQQLAEAQPGFLCDFSRYLHKDPRIFLPFCEDSNTSSLCLQPNEPKLEAGYVLASGPGKHFTDLIDMNGMVRHRWVYPDHPMEKSSTLTPNGTLFVHRHYRPSEIPDRWVDFVEEHDAAGLMTELDWDSKIVKECSYISDSHVLHHDAVILPNGNYLSIAFKRMDLEHYVNITGLSKKKGTKEGTQTSIESLYAYYTHCKNPAPGNIFVDGIVELKAVAGQKQCQLVWEWWQADHVIQEQDKDCKNYGVVKDNPHRLNLYFTDEMIGAETLHLNSLDYDPKLDQILLNSMITAEFYIIDHSTTTEEAASHAGGKYGKGGDILYRWGNDEAYHVRSYPVYPGSLLT